MLCVVSSVFGSIVPPGVPFSPMTYNSTVYDAFAAKDCVNLPTELVTDPYIGYNGTVPVPFGPDAVCGVKYLDSERHTYKLQNFTSIDEAHSNGAFVTHKAACNKCSSLADLSAFMSQPDLTDPIRKCEVEHLNNKNKTLECMYKNMNLSRPCTQTFFYNAIYDKKFCETICLVDFIEKIPNNLPPDNRLNDCLQCDEDEAGPIFKLYAGRNRRDSGLNSSIIRPTSQVFRIIHDYY